MSMADPLPVVARRALLVGMAAAAAAPALARAAQSAPGTGPEEQQAIGVIRAWAAALVAKDVDKVLSLTDDAIQYRDDPFQTELKKGKAQLVEDLRMLLRGLVAMEIESATAVGSRKNDVLVLVRRTDVFTLGDKRISMPMGSYYRVRNGKILEWLDTPLADMPPPPPGSPPPPGARPHP